MDAAERELWRQADRIFDEMIDLPDDQRDARLAALQSQPRLHAHVQRLLAAHDGAAGVLEQPVPIALMPEGKDALSGRQLGRWRLIEEIGRGGMSVVYRAVAEHGSAGQLAAVKVLTLAALADHGRERFLREQQALLRLRHPYLATLYDAGVADDGTPWLAMALVEGERIDQWCAAHQLDVRARVRLMLQVCEALGYAHRNLVIHRDIKPSNVLVDDDGHVRVLDFGIARLVDERPSERTATSCRALTPDYASPEQFTGAVPTTAMDVFGVGALLYRLLAGGVPRTTPNSAVTQPSRRVLAAADVPAGERKRRASSLRGDLDAITLKALSDEPGRRYASVDALADDLRRWLDRLPVVAQPPLLRYRARKFVARNAISVAAGLLLVTSLAAGVAGTLWQARQAAEQSRLASEAQARAEQALSRSNAVRDFLFELFRNTAPGQPRDQLPSTDELLEAALEQLPQRFKDDPETRAEFLEAMADVYKQRGMAQHLPLRRQVLALREQDRQAQPMAYAVAQANLAYSLAKSDSTQSLKLFAEAIARMQQVAPVSRELAHAHRQRAGLQMYLQNGPARLLDSARALSILEQLPDVSAREHFFAVASVASGHHQAGDYQMALDHYDKALGLAGLAFEGTHGWAVTNESNRAGLLSHLGRFAEAEAGFRKGLDDYARILERPNDVTLASLRELEQIQFRQGRYAQALEVRDEWDRMLVATGLDDESQQAKSKTWRAVTLVRLQRYEEARALIENSLPLLPGGDARGRNRLMAYSSLLRIACERPQTARAAADLLPALRDGAALAHEMRGDNEVHAAEFHATSGLCALRSGDPRLALVRLDQAVALHARLPPGDAAVAAEHLLWRGQALAALGDTKGAQSTWSEARRRLQEARLDSHPLGTALQPARLVSSP
jgi:serine/threonine-protein kinase